MLNRNSKSNENWIKWVLDEDNNVNKDTKQETTGYACRMMNFDPNIVWYHWYVEYKKVHLIETKSIMVVPWGWGGMVIGKIIKGTDFQLEDE